jgi:hypothetical protein
MNFFRDVVSHLLKNAFEGHTKFSVADNTAVGDNPIRAISLDAVPANEDTLISLSWDGGEKLFEKTLSEQEASHQFDLISTDLAEVAALTKQGEYDAAKDLMKKLGQKYAENTGDIVDTNLPPLHNTQASKDEDGGDSKSCPECDKPNQFGEMCSDCEEERNRLNASQDDKLWRKAKITMQNLWFSTTDELLDYQAKQKGAAKPGADQDHIPLWDKNKKAPAAKDQLAPASLSYEDVENQKEREHDDMQKHIDEKIKTELESALQEKAASVFGPDQVELVKVLRKNGRNWDEVKNILIKDFHFEKDATTIFVDEQRQGSDPTGIEVEPPEEKKEEKPLTPPEDLVSPETHEKLLKDHEDKKKDESPVKEPGFSPKEVMDIPEDAEITDESSQQEKCPSCGHMKPLKGECPGCKRCDCEQGHASSLDNEIARADNDEIHKVAIASTNLQEGDRVYIDTDSVEWGRVVGPATILENPVLNRHNILVNVESVRADILVPFKDILRQASLKTAADDLNPLQEPIQEKPTSSVPQQDKVPMGKAPLDHNAPQKGDRVFVSSDLTDEKAGFEATFISMYKSQGVDFSIVETDNGDLLDIESHRVVKTSEGDSAGSTGAQDTEPVMEPEIATTKEEDIPVTPKMDDLHSLSSLDTESARLKPGDHVRVAEGSGLDSGRIGVVVDQREFQTEVGTNERMVPNIPGHYKPVDWAREVAIRYDDDGSLQTVFKNRLFPVEAQASQDALASIKTRAEQLLKNVEGMGKTSYMFVRKGLEKHANDSAFEGNGWVRVWVQEDEVASNSKYPEILKMPDEAARIEALKELAREIAHEALSLADSSAAKVGVQNYIESLSPSDHDRIDWVALASPVNEEEEDAKFEQGMADKYGPDAAIPPKAKSSLEPKVEKKSSDFEKGISQNKTSAEPEVAPKTQFKDYKITPKYTPKEEAVPATPEMNEVFSKMDALEHNLATLETARKQLQAKLKEELAKMDQQGNRVEMEAEFQASIEKAGVLISAVESKVVSWKDKLYTVQTEQIDLVPGLTLTDWLEKFKKRFDEAEKFITDVKNGMLSQAKRVVEKTLIRWPNKKSSINKEASLLDDLNHYNDELMAALRELSSPL